MNPMGEQVGKQNGDLQCDVGIYGISCALAGLGARMSFKVDLHREKGNWC